MTIDPQVSGHSNVRTWVIAAIGSAIVYGVMQPE